MTIQMKNLKIKNELNKDVITLRGSIVQDNYYDDDIDLITPKAVDEALENAKSDNIEVVINSGGGDVYASIEIYNKLKSLNKNITTVISGRAFSGAHLIAMAGKERLIYGNSQGLAHNSSTVSWGNKEELADVIDFLDKIDDNLIEIYMNCFNGTEDELRELMKKGSPMNAKECLEKGFATRIIEFNNDENKVVVNENSTNSKSDGVDIDVVVKRVLEVLNKTPDIKVEDNPKPEKNKDKSLFRYFKEA